MRAYSQQRAKSSSGSVITEQSQRTAGTDKLLSNKNTVFHVNVPNNKTLGEREIHGDKGET